MGNPNRTVSMIECLVARGQNNFLRRRKRFEFPHNLGQKQTFAKMPHAKKKDRRKAVSPKPNRMFGSDGCALGVFDLEVASDSIEHGHLSLLDRCAGIVDGERSVFVQQLGIIRSVFNAQIVLPLGYLQL